MKIAFSDDAVAEIDEAAAFYRRKSEFLRQRFIDDVEAAARRIEEFPNAWPPLPGGLRRYLCSKFPYALIYKVGDETIQVYAVAHQRRRPGYWRRRVP